MPRCFGESEILDAGQVLKDFPVVIEHVDAVIEVGAGFHRIAYTHHTAEKPKYAPRIFDGRVMTPADLERVHKEILAPSASRRCPTKCAR
jgi:hypothetical protein